MCRKFYAIATMLLHIGHFMIYAFCGFCSWNESPGWWLVLSVTLTESRMTCENSLWAHRLINFGNSTLNVGGTIRWVGVLGSLKRSEQNRRLHLFVFLDSGYNETNSGKILPLNLSAILDWTFESWVEIKPHLNWFGWVFCKDMWNK